MLHCKTTWIEFECQILVNMCLTTKSHIDRQTSLLLLFAATLTYNCPLGGRRDPPGPPSRAGTGLVASWWKPGTPAPSEGSCTRLPPRWGWWGWQWVGGEGPPSCPAGLEEWGGSFWSELQSRQARAGATDGVTLTCCCPLRSRLTARRSSRLPFSESFCSIGEGLGCRFTMLWKRSQDRKGQRIPENGIYFFPIWLSSSMLHQIWLTLLTCSQFFSFSPC